MAVRLVKKEAKQDNNNKKKEWKIHSWKRPYREGRNAHEKKKHQSRTTLFQKQQILTYLQCGSLELSVEQNKANRRKKERTSGSKLHSALLSCDNEDQHVRVSSFHRGKVARKNQAVTTGSKYTGAHPPARMLHKWRIHETRQNGFSWAFALHTHGLFFSLVLCEAAADTTPTRPLLCFVLGICGVKRKARSLPILRSGLRCWAFVGVRVQSVWEVKIPSSSMTTRSSALRAS